MLQCLLKTHKIEYNQYHKSDKALCRSWILIEKIDECKNYLENLSKTKVGEHIPSDFSMFTILPFKNIDNKHNVHSDKDYIKKFCEYLRERAMEIINS